MRCLGLAQAWQDAGGTAEFVTRCEADALIDRLIAEGMRVTRLADECDWPMVEQTAGARCPAALVLDGYHFNAEYQCRAHKLCRPLLVIDDNAHLPRYCADLVLNQNIHAAELHYNVEPGTRLLLGCHWALLRKEFQRWQSWRREFPIHAHKILVTIGGSDPDNFTLEVIETLRIRALRSDLHAIVISGGGNPNLRALERAVASCPAIELRSNVLDMPSLMAWADVAITAGGSTCWETACLGLPSMTVIMASNQEQGTRRLEGAGATINLGWYRDLKAGQIAAALERLLAEPSTRQRMSETGRARVDGNGAPAVAQAIRNLL